MVKVTAVLTAHAEALLAGMSIASFNEAAAHAMRHGIEIEPIFILDRADALTREIFESNPVGQSRIVLTDFGDPGLSRNQGAVEATGDYVTFLDADDLWSFNWITQAVAHFERHRAPMIGHSELNVVFGDERNVWIHADSEAPGFDPAYLAIANYWDAMLFARRDILIAHPFRANDLSAGYGHEDWHFNCVTYLAGIGHRPIPDTVHMKRRRLGSQMAQCAARDVIPWPTRIYRHALEARARQNGQAQQDGTGSMER